ncbi:MAG: tetratricopeptide repeat protein [Anaerolineae bacterium]|nr:tetratricopeptide repeat protein [Anaerolineae bacterium]NUQ05331.1 tetratricopeptide repeat protein [Anaerolineae bacterium]
MLHIELLGGLHIRLNGAPVTGFNSAKAQALLCILALTRQSHLRSSLAAMFWGDMLDEDAAANLRQAIANLKKLFGPYLDITRQSVAFNLNQPYWLDVEAFETTQDAALYRGDLLAGFSVSDAPDFDQWLAVERERLHALARTALRRQAYAYLSEGQDEAGIATLNRLIEMDPLQEDVQRDLMRALAIDGQRRAALEQYQACATVLWETLRVEPEAETTRLNERIRSARRLSNLPAETTPLIGREEELAALQRRLDDPTCRLITLVGLGGIGKTRLALQAARHQARRMLHGAAMVNLAPARTLSSFLSALVDALQFPLLQLGTPHEQLLDYLREKHLLLVLDNLEQLGSAANDFLNEVIHTAAEVKIIVTSRQRLNLHSEWALAIYGLPLDGAASSQTLFWETARRVGGSALPADSESAAAVRRICQMVGGMPLAIELAAAWTRVLTCEELAEEIASNLTALEATTDGGEERHRSLRAVFDYSWRLFTEQEQRALMALSVFAAGFTREAAQAVAGASLSSLLGLADKMLLRREGEGRFSLHEMIRQYLLEKLPESGQMDQVRTAYLEYFAHFLQARAARLKTAEQQTLLKEITRDVNNLHQAWDTAVQSRDQRTLAALMPALFLFHDLKADWRLAEALLRSAESALDPQNADLYGEWLAHLALASSRIGQTDQTELCVARCLDLLSKDIPAHRASIARALLAMGYSKGLRGAYAEAVAHLQECLALRQTLGDEWDLAQCLMRIGSTYGQQAQYDIQVGESHREALTFHLEQARAAAEQAVAIIRRLGDHFLTARCQTLLATITQMEGRTEESETLHRSSLGFYEAVGSLDGLSLAYTGLGNAAHLRKEYALATDYYLKSLDLSRQIGARLWEANTLTNLAINVHFQGELRQARSYFQESQAVFRALGNAQYVTMIQQEIDALTEQIKAG